MVYVPEYAAEEVLVKPHDKYKEIRDISKIISIRSGYELKEKWYKDPEIYIFTVPVGQEDRAWLQFQEDKELQLTKSLMSCLNITKKEGEKVADYNKRVNDEINQILEMNVSIWLIKTK